MKLKYKESWTFNYRGFTAEIVHWGIDEKCSPKGTWNYYIYIPPIQIQDQKLAAKMIPELKTVNWGSKDRQIYKNINCAIIHDLEFHGGVTFCQPEIMDNGEILIKVGCDYNHLYDDETDWNEILLAFDAQNSIDLLHEKTKCLIFCHGNGNFYLELEGEYKDRENKSNFLSFEYIKTKDNNLNGSISRQFSW